MSNPDYTHLSLIVDRSGSMESVQSDAQGGINTLLKEQYGLPGKFTLTLSEFDDQFNTVVRMSKDPIQYSLIPRGMTALLDAVGMEIVRTGEDLAKLDENDRPARVLVVIVTDGQENSSQEYTLEKVKELTQHQREKYNWQFQFIGAGESAWQGTNMGMSATVYSGTGTGTRAAYGKLSGSISSYRSAAPAAAVFDMPEEVLDENL